MALAAMVRVKAAGVSSVIGTFNARPAVEIPKGFAKVCEEMGWPTTQMWKQLSDQKRPWFLHSNGAYIYWNASDRQWWVDEPNGNGVYVALSEDAVPPISGWTALAGGKHPLPEVEVEHARSN